VFIAFPIACTNILPQAAFADMEQYDTIKTGENKSAMFVAARQFVNKLAQAVVAVIISYVMYIGATDEYPTVWGRPSNGADRYRHNSRRVFYILSI
jgi:GPH family glycoside/pentoside/hexuronide:cation symporter